MLLVGLPTEAVQRKHKQADQRYKETFVSPRKENNRTHDSRLSHPAELVTMTIPYEHCSIHIIHIIITFSSLPQCAFLN
jgi:hypothetical protein